MSDTGEIHDPRGHGVEPLPGPNADPALQLAHLVPAMWRTMRRASRIAAELPANESQVSILRLLVDSGDRSPSQIATELRVARPTASNLLKEMVRRGLVERSVSPDDHRAIVISATPTGRGLLEAFRHDRALALHAAIESMSGEDQERLRECVAALRILQRHLESVADADTTERVDTA